MGLEVTHAGLHVRLRWEAPAAGGIGLAAIARSVRRRAVLAEKRLQPRAPEEARRAMQVAERMGIARTLGTRLCGIGD